MQIPKNGHIVIIDDKITEALPLMRALTKNGAPHLHYTGAVTELPLSQLTGTRIVFLDIELAGMSGQPDKTKASALTNILGKIISPENGPYIIVFWTTHTEVSDQVKDNLSDTAIEPVAYIKTDKTPYLNDEYSVDQLTKQLEDNLDNSGAFKLYVAWENIVNQSSTEFVKNFSALVPKGENWSKQTSDLFFSLYKSYVDKNLRDNDDEKFKCACLLVNRIFSETLHNITNEYLRAPNSFSLNGEGSGLSNEVKSKLNSSLFLSNYTLSNAHTGSAYSFNDENIKNMLVNRIFKADKIPKNLSLCRIVVTPECDLAQNKTLTHVDKSKIHQVVYAIIYNMEEFTTKLERKRINGSDSLFCISPLWHDNKSKILIAHTSTLTIIEESSLDEKPILSLSRDLTFDLQSKIANNINRLGNFLIQ